MSKSAGNIYYVIIKYRIYTVVLIERKEVINDITNESKIGWLVKKPNNEEIFIYSEFLYKKLDRAKRIRKSMIKNKIKSKLRRTYKNYSLVINFIKRLYFMFINMFCKLQYVILDCEFNNKNTEIIQMGLIKLTPNMEKIDSLNIFIKPIKPNVIHARKECRREILQKSNESEINFPMAIKLLNEWLGHNHKTILCTWSSADIAVIKKNLTLHNLPKNALNHSSFLDIQRFFTVRKDNEMLYPNLEKILNEEQIPVSEPLHNAIVDARLTANLLENIYSRQPMLIAQYLA